MSSCIRFFNTLCQNAQQTTKTQTIKKSNQWHQNKAQISTGFEDKRNSQFPDLTNNVFKKHIILLLLCLYFLSQQKISIVNKEGLLKIIIIFFTLTLAPHSDTFIHNQSKKKSNSLTGSQSVTLSQLPTRTATLAQGG